jgi:hypothetical protein
MPAGYSTSLLTGESADLDTGDAKDAAGRIFIQPFKTTEISPLQGFGFGAAGTIGDHTVYEFHDEPANVQDNRTTDVLFVPFWGGRRWD